jgi:hypothetical protein
MEEYCGGIPRSFQTLFMEALDFTAYTYQGLFAFGLIGIAVVTLYWNRVREKERREKPTLEKWAEDGVR